MPSLDFPIGVARNNPLVRSVYNADNDEGLIAPVVPRFLITEDGRYLTTEDGRFIVTEN